MNNYTAKKPT